MTQRLFCLWASLRTALMPWALAGLMSAGPAGAAGPPDAPQDKAASGARLQSWLGRMHEGNRIRAYVGTFVVSSGAHLSSARIWHVCEGEQQIERVDALTGTPRSVFRHNDQVLTLWPQTGVARSEKRESLGLFLDRLRTADARLAEHYSVKVPGQVDRVAGVSAEVVQLLPRDGLRFGYRVWLEQQSGLVVKLQTLDAAGQVLEQSAFSELQLDAPLKVDELLRMMQRTDGYRLETLRPAKTSLEAEGWQLRQAVPGFQALSCHKRAGQAGGASGLHCVFSDGLASVSVFLAPGAARAQEALMAMGATYTLRTQLQQHAATLMGEVPPATLRRFAAALERRPSSP